MPRFYFHLYNDLTSIDREGIELPDQAAAMLRASRLAREMAAESVRDGHLVLDHRIEVVDGAGELVGTIHFRDVVKVQEHETRH